MAEEEKTDQAAEAEGAEAVQKKEKAPADSAPNQKLVLLVLVMNAVVLVALAAIVWIGFSKRSSQVTLGDIAADKEKPVVQEKAGEGGEKGKEGGGEKKEEGDSDRFIKESFMVNLADPRGAHFAKVDVEIEVDDDFVRDEIEKKLKPKIRDFILVIMSSKTYEQIESVDGRDFLREEIRNKINGYLSRGKIKNVFFTQFIVQ